MRISGFEIKPGKKEVVEIVIWLIDGTNYRLVLKRDVSFKEFFEDIRKFIENNINKERKENGLEEIELDDLEKKEKKLKEFYLLLKKSKSWL